MKSHYVPRRPARPGVQHTVLCASLVALLLSISTVNVNAQPQAQPQPQPQPHVRAAKVAPAATTKPWYAGTTPVQRAQALTHFKSGNVLFLQSRFSEALAYYLLALKQWDHPKIRFNLAVSYVHLNQPIKAYKNLKRAARFGLSPLKKQFSQVITYLKLLKGQISTVRVSCLRAGATLTFDGKPLFTAPGHKTIVTTPGRHQIVASKSGYLTTTKNIILVPKEKIDIEVEPIIKKQMISGFKTVKRYHWYVPTIVSGTAAVLAAVGAGLLMSGRNTVLDIEDTINRDIAIYGTSATYVIDENSTDKAIRTQGVGIGFLAAAGAVALAGGILWLLWKKKIPVTIERDGAKVRF